MRSGTRARVGDRGRMREKVADEQLEVANHFRQINLDPDNLPALDGVSAR
jgi:hypothetical protein